MDCVDSAVSYTLNEKKSSITKVPEKSGYASGDDLSQTPEFFVRGSGKVPVSGKKYQVCLHRSLRNDNADADGDVDKGLSPLLVADRRSDEEIMQLLLREDNEALLKEKQYKGFKGLDLSVIDELRAKMNCAPGADSISRHICISNANTSQTELPQEQRANANLSSYPGTSGPVSRAFTFGGSGDLDDRWLPVIMDVVASETQLIDLDAMPVRSETIVAALDSEELKTSSLPETGVKAFGNNIPNGPSSPSPDPDPGTPNSAPPLPPAPPPEDPAATTHVTPTPTNTPEKELSVLTGAAQAAATEEKHSMLIGVPAEVKNGEYRVAVTPAGVAELTAHGHQVLVQAGAGNESSFSDKEYANAGATIVDTAAEVWSRAELVLKVKEPVESEYPLIRAKQIIFTYLHLAANRPLTTVLVESGATAIAYETVQLRDYSLPLLAPMSEIAGRLAVQIGAFHLMRINGGRGLLLGGVPGAPKGRVVVIGGGVAGEHAATMALGMGAVVTVFDVSMRRLRALDTRFGGRITTLRSESRAIADALRDADLVIGAVLVPGAVAPKLVTDAMVASMRKGSVLVDIAIDQGGCIEGSRQTTHDQQTFTVHDTVFYCVPNIPGAVPRTSTIALTNATLPFVLAIADLGCEEALAEDPALLKGLNVYGKRIVNEAVIAAHGQQSTRLARQSEPGKKSENSTSSSGTPQKPESESSASETAQIPQSTTPSQKPDKQAEGQPDKKSEATTTPPKEDKKPEPAPQSE